VNGQAKAYQLWNRYGLANAAGIINIRSRARQADRLSIAFNWEGNPMERLNVHEKFDSEAVMSYM
jgi:hypothetical protein